MNAIETPKNTSNIVTAVVYAFSSICLPHLTLRCIKLKAKFQKLK
jgi:hypothetical protein